MFEESWGKVRKKRECLILERVHVFVFTKSGKSFGGGGGCGGVKGGKDRLLQVVTLQLSSAK